MNQDEYFDFEVNKINQDDDPFARQKLLKDWDQDKVKNAKILVVGAGALGNEVLKNLALIGTGRIFVVDFDVISKSNLSRTVLYRVEDNGKDKAKVAAARTREFCVEPSAKVGYFSTSIVDNIGGGVFSKFDLVIGCIDNLEARLAISHGCWSAGIPWIDGSISGYHGNIVIFKPFETFCFKCTMSSDDEKTITERFSCDKRRFRAIAENKIPTIQTLSSIVAGIQVQEAMRLLHKDYSMVGKRISYDGSRNQMEISTSYPLKEHGESHGHGTYVGSNVEKLSQISVNSTLESFLSVTELLGQNFELLFSTRKGHDFIQYAHCKICSNNFDVNLPRFRIFADQYNKCPHCGATQPDNITNPDDLVITFEAIPPINQDNLSKKFLEMKLVDIGFAPLDIIEVVQKESFRFFELSADESILFQD